MPTMDKTIGDIVEMCRKGEVSVPHNPKLEDSYDNIMATFYAILHSADPDSGAIARLQSVLQERYDGKDNQGGRQIPLPKVPKTANDLFEFIFAKSTPYEILLMHPAVEAVGHQELTRELREYESKMIKFLQKSSISCKKRQVPLPLYKNHTHMAVVTSKEQVLLAVVLEMKEYFSKYLQLEETLFEGFDEGCTVLFFSILRVDVALLSPKVLSHLSELKRMFGMTHLIVFGYFACDLEKATIDSEIFVRKHTQCMHTHTCIYNIYKHTHTRARTHTHTHTHTHTYTHTHLSTYTVTPPSTPTHIFFLTSLQGVG